MPIGPWWSCMRRCRCWNFPTPTANPANRAGFAGGWRVMPPRWRSTPVAAGKPSRSIAPGWWKSCGRPGNSAPHAHLKINLWLPTLRIDRAVAVADLEATIQETARLLRENPYRQLLARVSDGAEVATRFLPYRPPDAGDPEAWARTVFAPVPGFGPDGHPVFDPATGEQVRVDRYTLMAGVTNAILFEYAARHEVTVELLPRENLLLSTKNAPGMAHQIKQVLGAASNAELYAIRFAFGDDRDAVSRVAVVLQQQPDYRLAVAGPFRLDTGPAYTPASVPSAHIAPPIPAASPPPRRPRPRRPVSRSPLARRSIDAARRRRRV